MIKGLFYYDGSFDLPPLFGIGALEAEADIAYNRRTCHGRHKPNFLRECCVIKSAHGESEAYRSANTLNKSERNVLVLTNSTFLLNFDRFTWDDEKHEFKVWFWDEHLQEFRHINDLTPIGLQKAYDIVKIYNSGGLDICPAWHKEENV